jgi:lysophospholipase L1-like esterase
MPMRLASPRTSSRLARATAAVAAIAAAAATGVATGQQPATSTLAGGRNAGWVAAWGAAPDSPGPSIAGSTVRQIVRTSLGGSRVRLRFSNLFGAAPVTLGPVRVALAAGAGAIQPASDRAVTFGGARVVTVARAHETVSDPIDLALPALARLAVTLHVPEGTGASTTHGVGHQTAYFLPGDATAVPVFPAGDADASRYFLTGVEVEAGPDAATVVVLGDSITDGVGSTQDRDVRWPDALAARLQANPTTRSIAVVNAGIAGNRLLNDGKPPFIGPSSLSRFDRDVLNTPGLRWIILLQGSNDVSAADMLTTREDQVSAAQIIDGMKALIARAHARGVRIYGGTMLPREGVRKPFANTGAGREKRRALNAWIRTAGAFDGVIDFDRAVRDPTRPDRLHPAFDSGDHLHPNDAGYAAMAAAVDPRLFATRRRSASRARDRDPAAMTEHYRPAGTWRRSPAP